MLLVLTFSSQFVAGEQGTLRVGVHAYEMYQCSVLTAFTLCDTACTETLQTEQRRAVDTDSS